MKEYIKDDKVIYASEKAYEVLYKNLGFIPKEEIQDERKKTSNKKK